MGGRAILSPRSAKHKHLERPDISMKEINDAEVRGISNEMLDDFADEKQNLDVEDGSFMVNIPKSVSKSRLVDYAEPDYMSEVRTHENRRGGGGGGGVVVQG